MTWWLPALAIVLAALWLSRFWLAYAAGRLLYGIDDRWHRPRARRLARSLTRYGAR